MKKKHEKEPVVIEAFLINPAITEAMHASGLEKDEKKVFGILDARYFPVYKGKHKETVIHLLKTCKNIGWIILGSYFGFNNDYTAFSNLKSYWLRDGVIKQCKERNLTQVFVDEVN